MLNEEELNKRDPDFIKKHLPKLNFFFDHYHDVKIEGLEDIPPAPSLIVGNHNGGIVAPDMFALMQAHWRLHGLEDAAYGLMHDFIFKVPIFGSVMAKFGAVPANRRNAEALLKEGARVLVYPGGDLDAFRPSRKKEQIVFGERRGFIRLAIQSGVPIVPVVSAGAHDGFYVLSDGVEFARTVRLKRWTRIEVFPVALGLPWGIGFGPLGYIPPPLRIRLRVLRPICWPELPKEAANDDAIVDRCKQEVHALMQEALTDLIQTETAGLRLPWRR